MELELTPLQNAVDQLEKSLIYCHSKQAAQDKELFFQFRSAAIQAFEYTFELCVKMLRRQLEEMESIPTITQMSYRELMRTGAQKGFIDDPVAWFYFREKRNLTAHTYDAAKAELIYQGLPIFLASAKVLLKALQRFQNHAH